MIGLTSAEDADREWAANGGSRPEDEDETLTAARARKESAAAELKEIELAEAKGELMPTSEAKAAHIDAVTRAKTKLLAIPSKARQQLPHLSLADVAMLEELVREALGELSA